MFRRILVAIDSSAQAQQALAVALDLALATNARLTVMTVVPKPAVVVLGYGVAVYTEDPWDRIERECATLVDAWTRCPTCCRSRRSSSTGGRPGRSSNRRWRTTTT